LIGECRVHIIDRIQAAGEVVPSPLTAVSAGGRQQEGTYAMTYGHSTRVFLEDGPVEQVAKANALRTSARAWRVLDEARRLELVERILFPANDCIDRFPLAL
jgi:hypothetical protein